MLAPSSSCWHCSLSTSQYRNECLGNYGHYELCVGKVVSGGCGIVVGLTHGKCGMCTLVSGCLRGERQEMILLVELLNFVCHDECCTEQTYA